MNVVVTNLLTAQPDPQRKKRLRSDARVVGILRASVRFHGHHLVVLNDCLDDGNDDLTTFVRVPAGGNPYFARWANVARWIDLNEKVIDRVWCVDGTDVVMLHDPFPHMQPDVLYSGSEPYPLGGDTEYHAWLRRECPSRRAFYDSHPERPFLNPGILGGSAKDVRAAAAALAASGVDNTDLCDMGAWQSLAYALFADRLVTGHPVHTEYKAYQLDDDAAWWAHK